MIRRGRAPSITAKASPVGLDNAATQGLSRRAAVPVAHARRLRRSEIRPPGGASFSLTLERSVALDPYLRASVMRGERLDAETGSAPGIRTGWSLARAGEREELARRALETDAGRQFARCFGTHGTPVASLRPGALLRLADNRAVDRNDGGTWNNSDAHAGAVLRRHGLTRVSPDTSSCRRSAASPAVWPRPTARPGSTGHP